MNTRKSHSYKDREMIGGWRKLITISFKEMAQRAKKVRPETHDLKQSSNIRHRF